MLPIEPVTAVRNHDDADYHDKSSGAVINDQLTAL